MHRDATSAPFVSTFCRSSDEFAPVVVNGYGRRKPGETPCFNPILGERSKYTVGGPSIMV